MEHLAESAARRDEVIYARTAKGQRELVYPIAALNKWERRFLACVTGHTPLRVLMDLGLDGLDVRLGISRLVAQGLIVEAGGASVGAPDRRLAMPAVPLPAGGARQAR